MRAGQVIGVVGALMLLTSLFIGGWYHVNHIDVTLGERQVDDSYIGQSLTLATNYYSLAVWVFLKRGYAIPVLIAAVGAAAISLLIVGRRRRSVMALGMLFAVVAALWIVWDLRQLPMTVLATAKNASVGFPTAVQPRGTRPGPMMALAFSGLTLQITGALIAFVSLPRIRRVRRVRPARPQLPSERQPQREEQPVHELQPGGTGEYAVQGTAPLPAETADERWREHDREKREQYPG